jgi:tRNA G37 N-methylase Trm5
MRIDFTLTLPGLFEVPNIQQLAAEFDVDVLAKVVFSFTPDIILSPLALPRELLDRKINELVAVLPAGALRDVLVQLRSRPTFAEQWGDGEAAAQLIRGKHRIQKLEHIRGDGYTLADIVEQDPEIKAWYDGIA